MKNERTIYEREPRTLMYSLETKMRMNFWFLAVAIECCTSWWLNVCDVRFVPKPHHRLVILLYYPTSRSKRVRDRRLATHCRTLDLFMFAQN